MKRFEKKANKNMVLDGPHLVRTECDNYDAGSVIVVGRNDGKIDRN